MFRLVAIVVLLFLTGCATISTVAPQDEGPHRLGRPSPIAGFTTRDGATHPHAGYVRVDGDSLVFLRSPSGWGAGFSEPVREFALPESEVVGLQVTRPNRTRGLLLFGVVTGFTLAVIMLIGVTTQPGPIVF